MEIERWPPTADGRQEWIKTVYGAFRRAAKPDTTPIARPSRPLRQAIAACRDDVDEALVETLLQKTLRGATGLMLIEGGRRRDRDKGAPNGPTLPAPTPAAPV